MRLETELPVEGYRALGLVGNPLMPPKGTSMGDPIGVSLLVHAAVLRALGAIENISRSEEASPLIIEKDPELPMSYSIAAFAELIAALSSDVYGTSILPFYVPIETMRLGRVRAVLSTAAEQICGRSVSLTLGLWAAGVLADPDTELAQWEPLAEAGEDVAAIRAALASHPAETASRLLGDDVPTREGAEDIEQLLKVSTARQRRLDVDPAETLDPTADEESSDDPMNDSFVTPLGKVEENELPAPTTVDEEVADYLIAYAKAHLSPVVARAMRAYRAQGTTSMAEELKVTKAPTKTLSALLNLASVRWSRSLVLFDRIELWESMPDDLRRNVAGTLTRLRDALSSTTILALMMARGVAPQIEEDFASAARVSWAMPELDKIGPQGLVFDAEAARSWMHSALIDSEGEPEWFEALLVRGEEDLGEWASRAGAAIEAAAQAGASEVDTATIEAAFTGDIDT